MRSDTKFRWSLVAMGVCALAAAASARGTAHGPWVQLRDGQRVKSVTADMVYLVEDGRLRPLSLGAYKALWPSFDGICEVDAIPEASVGPLLGDGTRLVRADGDPKVWLVEAGRLRRHVTSPEVMRSYRFSWDRVHVVTAEDVRAIPEERDFE